MRRRSHRALSLADLGLDAGTIGEAGSSPRSRADDRRRRAARREGRRRRQRAGEIVEFLAETPRLTRSSSSSTTTTSPEKLARRARGGGAGDVHAVVVGSGSRPRREPRAGRRPGRRTTTRRSTRRSRRRASTCRAARARRRYDTVLFGQSVLAADVASGLAARLDAGLNWDLTDSSARQRPLVGKRPALQDSVYRRRRLEVGAAPRAVPLRRVRPR